MDKNIFIKDLGEGLVLRHATPADAPVLSDFNARIHSDEPDSLDAGVAVWTRDLLLVPHPTFTPGDFTIVEDTRQGKIVSSLNLISQTWSYAGIPFRVGRPELVGTDPEYRNRGLVRAQFDEIHRWSAERGELVQAITGIPYYYRLFGYEMAMNLGGGRAGFAPHVPKLKDGEKEPYCLRPAQDGDLDFIAATYRDGCQRALVRVERDRAMWEYELTGKSPDNVNRVVMHVIENEAGEPVGFIGHPPARWGELLVAGAYELKPGVSWGAVTPSVVRYLKAVGEVTKPFHGDEPWNGFGFWLGEAHPVYDVLADRLPRVREPYAWYLRVPDLLAFIRLIAPVLEKRLADSVMVGHTGELKISFYKDGLKLVFDKGRLAEVEAWKPTPFGHSGQAGFPGLTFLQLLFGYRSLEELRYAFADCWVNRDENTTLVGILFPRQPSDLWPVS